MRTGRMSLARLIYCAALAGCLFMDSHPSAGAAEPAGGPEGADTTRTPVLKENRNAPGARLDYVGPQPFTVLHYRLDLRFAMTTEAMGGTVTMTVVPTQAIDSLTLNAAQLAIDTARVNGLVRGVRLDPANEQFSVALGTTAQPGETLTVALSYRRVPGPVRPSGRLGYYWFPKNPLGGLPDTLGYTMSEPSDARFWMPCYDQPWQKSTAEIFATVPEGYVAASNGRLLGTAAHGDGTRTWHWLEIHPLATYLMAVTVSRWAVSTVPFVRAPGDTVPVQYYVFAPDSGSCAVFLPTVARMIGALGKLFGPYPFDKYGMTGVTPFGYGGMEHQTITTLDRSAETDPNVVVHELTHQWWGDLVTCGTWRDIWLNESFASYGEALWQEANGGLPALRSYMIGEHERFGAASWSGAIYDPQGQGFDLFANSVYSKGAWVLHALRGVLGDSLFFTGLRAYRAKFQYRSAVTDELRAVLDSVAGRSMAWFFKEWIYGRGWPQYASSFTYSGDTLRLTIYQRQNQSWPVFTMPVPVRAYGSGLRDTTFTVQDTGRVQTFQIPLAHAPDSVALDPDGWILKQIVAPPASAVAENEAAPGRFTLDQNYPNPFNPRTVITYALPARQRIRLVVYDMLGREVAVLVDGVNEAGRHSVAFDGNALASGVYVYQLEGSGLAARKMVLIK